jgi:hypothetical protein
MEIIIGDWASDSSFVGSSGTTSGAIPNVAGSLITNADQGVLYSWGACIANPNTGQCTPQYNLTTIAQDGTPTTVPTNLGATNSPISPYALSPVQPALQRADNSYIGTLLIPGVSQSMIAFTASGQQLWSQSNYTPQIATSGGGVIAQSQSAQAVTFDTNGNQTGQMASLPTQSWAGNSYQMGSVDQVAVTPLITSSLWAWQGGNPSGTKIGGRPWYFILVWQNDFTFTPDYPRMLNLTTDISNDAITIKTAALKALKQAYFGFPVTAVEGTPNTGDNQATVMTRQTLLPTPNCGVTFIKTTQVDYLNNMLNAQDALQITITNAATEASALQNPNLIQAIGRGIGNVAAHEIAHQFLVLCCDMDANPTTDANARGAYNAGGCTASVDPSPWLGYWPSPKLGLHWETPALQGLDSCLNRGWRDLSPGSCSQDQ